MVVEDGAARIELRKARYSMFGEYNRSVSMNAGGRKSGYFFVRGVAI
jgi:hypothetical protein